MPLSRGVGGASLASPPAAELVNLYLSTGMPVPIVLSHAYGTIVPMADHRIRLSDEDIALVLASLRARRRMTSGLREHRVDRLIARLSEGSRGNPKWLIDEDGQTHEENLADDD